VVAEWSEQGRTRHEVWKLWMPLVVQVQEHWEELDDSIGWLPRFADPRRWYKQNPTNHVFGAQRVSGDHLGIKRDVVA